ncbi:MAG: YceI family protein [Planctomycetota bacterium]|mgnify:CR=1 FL=1
MIRSLSLALFVLTAPLAAADWTIDGEHSNALFKIQHMNAGYTWGRFDDISGSIRYDEANQAGSKVTVSIKAASISTKVQKMEEHLRSATFFDVVQHPTLGFVSTAWKKTADGVFDVTGNLTIHGVTKAVTIKVTRTGLGENAFTKKAVVGFESTFAIKRSDYGMTNMLGPVGDDVTLTIALEAMQNDPLTK